MKDVDDQAAAVTGADRGTLWIVATPIGNLGDVSARAARILAQVHTIACEDTRHTRRLTDELGLDTPLLSYHDHNEEARIPAILDRLSGGHDVALVSDAGTPLISDPGYRLVQAAIEAGYRVSPVPGPAALIAALSVAGLATDRFEFLGFAPAKAAARRRWLQSIAQRDHTLVFYESPRRISACLQDAVTELGGERRVCVCRELTKLHETVLRGGLASVHEQVVTEARHQKGEIVVLLEGSSDTPGETRSVDPVELAKRLAEHLPASKAARIAASVTGASRQTLFNAIAGKGDEI